MTNDLDALEAVAKAATQGEWSVLGIGPAVLGVVSDFGALAYIDGSNDEANATYIATFCPTRILALTAEIRGLREALEEIASDTFNGPPGIGIFAAAANELTRRQVIARAALAQGER